MLTATAFTFASCDGGKDAGYVEGAQSSGAYFVSSNPVYEVKDDQTSFSIPVARVSSSDPATVTLVAQDESGLFSIPNQVTFAEGALEADLKIGYDATQLEYDKNYKITLAIQDGNVYGNSTYVFSVKRPAPWITLGKGLYTDGIMMGIYNIDQLTYEVEVQESETTKGLYRVKNPYGPKVFAYTEAGNMVSNDDYYMVVNAVDPDKVYVETFCTNMIWDASLGVMTFTSRAYKFLQNNNPLDAIAAAGYCGTNKDGVITMPGGQAGFLFQGTVGDYADGWYYVSNGANWRLVLPGVEITDYSASVEYVGRFTDTEDQTFLSLNVSLGDDVETARVAAAVTNNNDALEQAIINGEVDFVELKGSGDIADVRVPVSESGIYTIMVVTFAKGEAQASAATVAEISLGGSQWEAVGRAAILDGWLLGASNSYADKYDQMLLYCDIQRSTTREGVYRLVQPYGPDGILGDFAEPGIYNIEINAADVNNVYIEPQCTGNGFFSDGVAWIATIAALNKDITDEQKGTFSDNTFLFPEKTCCFSFGDDKWYLSDNMGGVQIIGEEETASKSFKAVKKNNAITGSKAQFKATPYVKGRELNRYVTFTKAK